MMKEKKQLRKIWKNKRKAISSERKQEAPLRAISELTDFFKKHRYVLSYASFVDEFSTFQLNQRLAETGKLLLPKVIENHLKIFLVENIANQLKLNSWGIMEPIPEICQEIHAPHISFVLVPGLTFDASHHRLGYGKGYYDRFLKKLSTSSLVCGLGFKEQLTHNLLPSTTTDIPLQSLLLF